VNDPELLPLPPVYDRDGWRAYAARVAPLVPRTVAIDLAPGALTPQRVRLLAMLTKNGDGRDIYQVWAHVRHSLRADRGFTIAAGQHRRTPRRTGPQHRQRTVPRARG